MKNEKTVHKAPVLEISDEPEDINNKPKNNKSKEAKKSHKNSLLFV